MVCRQWAEPSALTPVADVAGIRKEMTSDVAAPLVDQQLYELDEVVASTNVAVSTGVLA